MNNKQRAMLRRIFQTPTPADIPWTDIVSLLRALGATIGQGRGSRIRVTLNQVNAVLLLGVLQPRARPMVLDLLRSSGCLLWRVMMRAARSVIWIRRPSTHVSN